MHICVGSHTFMSASHNNWVATNIYVGPRGYLKRLGKSRMSASQRMISCNIQGGRKPSINSLRVVCQCRSLAMQDLASNINLATKHGDDALMPHTDPENRYLPTKMLDSISANTRISLGMSWTRAYNKLSRLLLDQFS